jgi:hypothetical protein
MRTRILGAGERMAATLASVQEIAIAQAGTTGRKNLIWIRQGLPSVDGRRLSARLGSALNSIGLGSSLIRKGFAFGGCWQIEVDGIRF